MVTLAGNQNFNEFELHARALLGLNIPEIELRYPAVSAVVLAEKEGEPSLRRNGKSQLENRSRMFKLIRKANDASLSKNGCGVNL